jgi:hypothetical protein
MNYNSIWRRRLKFDLSVYLAWYSLNVCGWVVRYWFIVQGMMGSLEKQECIVHIGITSVE